MSQLKKWGSIVAFILLLGISVWQSCFSITNKVGPAGMDKAGRQIFLQSLEHYFDTQIDTLEAGYAVDITSAFYERPFIFRLFQEPMRTTFRMRYRIINHQYDVDRQFHKQFLDLPASTIVKLFGDSLYMRENRKFSTKALEQRLNKLNVKTLAELLSALGFRQFNVIIDDKNVVTKSLPNVGAGNTGWRGK